MQPWQGVPLETFQADVEQILVHHAKQTAREIRTELAKTRARTQGPVPSLAGISATRSCSSVPPAWTRGFYDAAKLAACESAELSPVKKRSTAGPAAALPDATGLSYSTILRNAFKLKDIAQALRDEAHERAANEAAMKSETKPTKRPTADVNSIMKCMTEMGARRKTLFTEQGEGGSQPRKSVKKKSEFTKAEGKQNGQQSSPSVHPTLKQAINEAAQEEMVGNSRGRLGRPDLKREYSVGQTTSVVQPPFQAGNGMESPSASPHAEVPPPSPVHPAAQHQQPLSSRAFMEAWERREQGSPRTAQAERLAAQTADLHRTLAEITANLEKAQVIGRGRSYGADAPGGDQES